MKGRTVKMKKQKKTSIRTTTVFVLMLLMIISNIVTLGANSYFVKNYFAEEITKNIQYFAKEIAMRIEQEFTSVEIVVDQLANTPILQSSSENKKKMYYNKQAEKLNFISFAYTDLKKKQSSLTPNSEILNHLSDEGYEEELKGNTNIRMMDEEKMILISSPVYNEESKIIGVFSAIKSSDFLNAISRNFDYTESTEIHIFNKHGHLLAATDADHSEHDHNKSVKLNEIFSEKEGSGEYNVEGKDKLAGFYTLDSREIIVLITIDSKLAFSAVRKLAKSLILVSFVVLILLFAYFYFDFSKRVANSYVNMRHDIENLAAYNLNYESTYNYSSRTDELGDIYRAILILKENLIKIVTDINTLSQNTASTAEELTTTATDVNEYAFEVTNSVSNIARGATNQAGETTGYCQVIIGKYFNFFYIQIYHLLNLMILQCF